MDHVNIFIDGLTCCSRDTYTVIAMLNGGTCAVTGAHQVPHCTYMEIDSAKYDESLKAPTTWKEQAARYNTTPPPK